MNLSKYSRLFSLAVTPVLIAGLFFALRMNADKDAPQTQPLPGITIPQDQGSEPPSIVPHDSDPAKIEYRNVLFNGNSEGRSQGLVKTSVAASAGSIHI